MTRREEILAKIAEIIDDIEEKSAELQHEMHRYWDETATETAENHKK